MKRYGRRASLHDIGMRALRTIECRFRGMLAISGRQPANAEKMRDADSGGPRCAARFITIEIRDMPQ